MGNIFGTDGIRGVANIHPMTAEYALEIGRAAAYVCKRHERRHRILIGKDTRLSGYMIENALTAGICSMGVDVLLVGPMPTPGIAFITYSMRADMGIVISASHNPYQDNGIKIFSCYGFKLSDSIEKEIESIVSSGKITHVRPTAGEIGRAKRIDDAMGRYIVFCKNTFPADLTLEGMKIVVDCANGATYKVAPIVLSELGAEVIAIHNEPNGTNINDNCGSQFTSDLSAAVLKHKADIGLAFDGDGDRLIVVDEKGRELDGDHVMAICAADMKKTGKLNNNLVVITPMSNLGLRLAFKEMNIKFMEASVGDRNVLEMMQKQGATMGGEQSGHIIFLDRHTTGDGIVASLQLLAIARKSGKKLSQLAKTMKVFPQKLVNVKVTTKPPIKDVPGLMSAIKKAEAKLKKAGRVLVRYSGTQPICRVMVEGPTDKITGEITDYLVKAVKKTIA